MNKATREDMLVELASERVNAAAQIALQDYEAFHAWLQPLFIQELKQEFFESSDDDLACYYYEQICEWPQGYGDNA